MTAHTIVCPGIDGADGINLSGFHLLVQLNIGIVITIVIEIDLGIAVAIDAPTH